MNQEKDSQLWPKFSDHLTSMMKEMRMNEDFSDVTLVSEDKKLIKAHKNILSACSPFFKEILKTEINSKPIIYLKGIHHFEVESIMQFIYLGEATFYEERMDEFLAVAKSLEIEGFEEFYKTEETMNNEKDEAQNKQEAEDEPQHWKSIQIEELCSAETKVQDEQEDDPLKNKPVTISEASEEKCMQSDQKIKDLALQKHRYRRREGGNYKCEQCFKTYFSNDSLKNHIRAIHEGLTYACSQCDYKTPKESNLKVHNRIQHELVRYACNQCDFTEFTRKSDLKIHIQSLHEGVKYACNLCGYLASHPSNLSKHKRNKLKNHPCIPF